MDDLGQQVERWVLDLVLDDDRLEAASAVHVAQLDVGHVVGVSSLAVCHGPDLVRRDEEKLSLGVDEPADQPRAGDSVDVRVLPRYPLHRTTSWFAPHYQRRA